MLEQPSYFRQLFSWQEVAQTRRHPGVLESCVDCNDAQNLATYVLPTKTKQDHYR